MITNSFLLTYSFIIVHYIFHFQSVKKKLLLKNLIPFSKSRNRTTLIPCQSQPNQKLRHICLFFLCTLPIYDSDFLVLIPKSDSTIWYLGISNYLKLWINRILKIFCEHSPCFPVRTVNALAFGSEGPGFEPWKNRK